MMSVKKVKYESKDKSLRRVLKTVLALVGATKSISILKGYLDSCK